MRTAIYLGLALGMVGCKGDAPSDDGPDFEVRPGVESVTVFGAEPGASLTSIIPRMKRS